jgi:hypothetical protein
MDRLFIHPFSLLATSGQQGRGGGAAEPVVRLEVFDSGILHLIYRHRVEYTYVIPT